MSKRIPTGLISRALTLCATFTAAFGVRAAEPPTNPLLAEWTGEYGGVPPFDKVKAADFKPAFDIAMAAKRAEIAVIVGEPSPATFANSILAYERSGTMLRRVGTVYGVWSGSLKSEEFKKVEQEMAPKLARFDDEISHNAGLFQRIEKAYHSQAFAKLGPEDRRLGWRMYTDFVLSGARLNETQKKRSSEINERLASLYSKFGQNELGDEESVFMTIDRREDLSGLPDSQIDGAAAEAQRRGLTGKWALANTRSSVEPFLTYANDRALREKAFRMWTSRGDGGGERDNNKLISEILRLRNERAKILGYKSFPHWKLADSMAKTPEAATALMEKVWKPAVQRARREIADLQAIVDEEKGGFKIEPWDYRYHAEKVRKAKYDLDLGLAKPYLELSKVREALFWQAEKLYGYTFTPNAKAPVFISGASVYEVRGRDKNLIGLWYFDPLARAGKNSGAWMEGFREQQKLDGIKLALVSNNSNFIAAKPGEPVYLSWSDANTMFHEFGHALHGLSSNVTYRSLSGTNTATDFVEFPSQINENWLFTDEIMNRLTNAKGEAMPKELRERIVRAKKFNAGFEMTEFLASALMDMKIHLAASKAGAKDIDPREFEKAELKKLGMPSEIVMRHRLPAFGHIFSGEGYAAGYYSYLWSQVLDHDAFEAFTEASGPYDQVVATRFREKILAVGNSVDPAEAYRSFRGRDPKPEALLRARGLD